ncbi:MAG: hypothetical protein ACRC0F_11420 [Cetobacterium sp.]
MIEEVVKELMGYGVGGVILAYFLYNDFQDRRAFRSEMLTNKENINNHETRIVVLEKHPSNRD